MLKSGTNPNIFSRLYGKASQTENQNQQIMDNIYFLNKHCKFLSFSEKENLIILIKQRDPQVEHTITEYKENKISKEGMKDSFYFILYPKRFTKKQNENTNPIQPDCKSSREMKRSTPNMSAKTSLGLDNGSLNDFQSRDNRQSNLSRDFETQKKQSFLASQKSESTVLRQLERNNGLEMKKGDTKEMNQMKKHHKQQSDLGVAINLPAHKKKLSEIDKLTLKLQKQMDEYLKYSDINESLDSKVFKSTGNLKVKAPVNRNPSSEANFFRKDGNIKSAEQQVSGTYGMTKDENTNRRQIRGRFALNDPSKRRIPSSSPVKYNQEDTKGSMTSFSIQNPEMEKSFQGKSNESVISYKPVDRSSQFDSQQHNQNTSQSISQYQSLTRSQIVREKHLSSEFSLNVTSIEIDLRASKEEATNKRLTAQFIIKEESTNQYNHGPSKKVPNIAINDTYKISSSTFEKPQSDSIQELKQPSFAFVEFERNEENRQAIFFAEPTNVLQASNLVRRSLENPCTLNDSMNSGDLDMKDLELTPDATRNSIKVEETKQNIPSLKGSPLCIRDNTELTMSRSHNTNLAGVSLYEQNDQTKQNVSSLKGSPLFIRDHSHSDFAISKSQTTNLAGISLYTRDEQRGREGVSTCSETYFNYLLSKSENTTPNKRRSRSTSPFARNAKTNLDTSHFLAAKADRYISVNLLKRIFDENTRSAEDIVDEVFRYLGEFMVNKNYFIQIMTSYLTSLPNQCGLKVKDLAQRVFELCDRNDDGMISVNDLGSTATLFAQSRNTKSKEKALFEILDPSERGFIIEADVVNLLTTVQTLACAKRVNLYDDQAELLKEAKKIMKELDKEKKGVATYWDIFLWKDTESFADLYYKLEKYGVKLDVSQSRKTSPYVSIAPSGNPEVQFYSAEKAYEECTLTSPPAFKPFTSVFQPKENEEIIEPDKFMTPLSFQAKSISDSGNTDSKNDYIRATADFAYGLEFKLNQESAKKAVPHLLQASLKNIAIKETDLRDSINGKLDDIYQNRNQLESSNMKDSFEPQSSLFETWKMNQESQLTHRKVSKSRKEHLLMDDSETEPAASRELYSRRGNY